MYHIIIIRLIYTHTLPVTYSWTFSSCSDWLTHTLPVTYYSDLIIMFRIAYTHTACNLLLDLIFMFRLTYTHTACHLLLRPYHHVQTSLHNILLATYSSDIILMFRLTHQHSLPVTYSPDLTIIYRLTYTHTLPVTYSLDLILMFRLTYQHTVFNLLMRPYYYVLPNLPIHNAHHRLIHCTYRPGIV